MNHFDFYNMTLGGVPFGEPVACSTSTGVMLQCHPQMDVKAVEHMCAMANLNPHQPYDLCHWSGEGNERRMVWTARIYWRAYDEKSD